MQARSRSSRYSYHRASGICHRSESGLRGAAPRRTACACRRGPRGEQRGPNVGPAGRGCGGSSDQERLHPPARQAEATAQPAGRHVSLSKTRNQKNTIISGSNVCAPTFLHQAQYLSSSVRVRDERAFRSPPSASHACVARAHLRTSGFMLAAPASHVRHAAQGPVSPHMRHGEFPGWCLRTARLSQYPVTSDRAHVGAPMQPQSREQSGLPVACLEVLDLFCDIVHELLGILLDIGADLQLLLEELNVLGCARRG